MLFRSTLAIFLLAIPSVLSERESKLPKSGGQSRRRVLKGDKATVEPSEQVSEPCLDCGPTVVQRSWLLQSDETFVSFGASEVPMLQADQVVRKLDTEFLSLETDSGFVPGIVGTVFVNRGFIVGIDGELNPGLGDDYAYTITCTVLEGDFTDLRGDDRERKMEAVLSSSSFEFSKVSCDIDVCDGIDVVSNTPVCLHLRFISYLNGSVEMEVVPTSGMPVRSRKLTEYISPPYFGDDVNEEFRASVLSGTVAWRGSIGEAVLKQVDYGMYQMDVGVLINDYGDLVDTTTGWE